ncbi:class I SAM-dependent methyltransferase [Paenibacillus antri]|uniref:class I SAM-dependent methyltransferase n=1 Tax=Paenibacillus antri TaxID=2582848 RepID=UPI001EE43B82|nr:SAM-dependent methyltransferase [Paenibacillus antri]
MAERRNRAVEEALAERLRLQGGRMTFADYMELCLYLPEAGYYQRSEPKLGKNGDFYTSAHIGSFMGGCIAASLDAAARRLTPDGGDVAIVEWGGGDGRLAEAVLSELRDVYPETYARVRFLGAEGSPYHRALQRERLRGHEEKIEGIVEPDDDIVERAFRDSTTLIFANELLDAFPVRRLVRARGEWMELYVEGDPAAGTLREAPGPIGDARLAAWLAAHPVRGKEGQRIEVGLAGLEWLSALGRRLRRGFVLLADYGDVSAELYAPHRMTGTLLAYRKHAADEAWFREPGEQDLTAHVNFEWCAAVAGEAGFGEIGVTTQKSFLVEHGILNKLRNHDGADPFSPEARANRAIRQLLLSDGMSELFKVMTMWKGVDAE